MTRRDSRWRYPASASHFWRSSLRVARASRISSVADCWLPTRRRVKLDRPDHDACPPEKMFDTRFVSEDTGGNVTPCSGARERRGCRVEEATHTAPKTCATTEIESVAFRCFGKENVVQNGMCTRDASTVTPTPAWKATKQPPLETTPHHTPHQSLFENRMHDFEIGTVVGTGTFGRVQIGLHKKTGTPVAIKTLSKSEVLFARHAEHVLAEHAVLKTVCGATGGYPFQFGDDGSVIDSGRNHPFLITFFGSAQDDKHVRFVMEYVPGGELFSHLRLAGNFSDAATKFYACEVLLALEFLHDLQIVYRDLKPENVLLCALGHVKLTDFGFAKALARRDEATDEANTANHASDGDASTSDKPSKTGKEKTSHHRLHRTYTLCGTPEYLAPETVLGSGHGCEVDWWALGVLVFEMLAGYPPFKVGSEPADATRADGNGGSIRETYGDDDEYTASGPNVSRDTHLCSPSGDSVWSTDDPYSPSAKNTSDAFSTYRSILRDDPVFPSHFSKNAKDVLGVLLRKNPSERGKGRRGGFRGCDLSAVDADNAVETDTGASSDSCDSVPRDDVLITSRAWFANVDWERVATKQTKPPLVPCLQSNTCTSQYDTQGLEETPLSYPFKLTKEEQAVFDGI